MGLQQQCLQNGRALKDVHVLPDLLQNAEEEKWRAPIEVCRITIKSFPLGWMNVVQTKVMRLRAWLTCHTFSSSYSSKASWNWAGVKPRETQRCSASAIRTTPPAPPRPATPSVESSRTREKMTSDGRWVLDGKKQEFELRLLDLGRTTVIQSSLLNKCLKRNLQDMSILSVGLAHNSKVYTCFCTV